MSIMIQESIPLAPLTTFRIGGAARYFVTVQTREDLQEAIAWARQHRIAWTVLAGGSNVLVADNGFDGLVLHMCMTDVRYEGTQVIADAGAVLVDVITDAAAHGLGGWSGMAGIPGTIGGAVRGNAGAFGTEICDVLTTVEAYDTETAIWHTYDRAACAFGYRESFFKTHPTWIVGKVICTLTPGDPEILRAANAATIAEREKRHLQNVRAAGSFYTNPQVPQTVQEQFARDRGMESRGGKVPVGWLIEEAGMKGYCIGGACSSAQHANYVINADGNATAEQVMQLSSMITMRVRDRFGVQLRPEVSFMGF